MSRNQETLSMSTEVEYFVNCKTVSSSFIENTAIHQDWIILKMWPHQTLQFSPFLLFFSVLATDLGMQRGWLGTSVSHCGLNTLAQASKNLTETTFSLQNLEKIGIYVCEPSLIAFCSDCCSHLDLFTCFNLAFLSLPRSYKPTPDPSDIWPGPLSPFVPCPEGQITAVVSLAVVSPAWHSE